MFVNFVIKNTSNSFDISLYMYSSVWFKSEIYKDDRKMIVKRLLLN